MSNKLNELGAYIEATGPDCTLAGGHSPLTSEHETSRRANLPGLVEFYQK